MNYSQLLVNLARVQGWLRLGCLTSFGDKHRLGATHQVTLHCNPTGRVVLRYCVPSPTDRGVREWHEIECADLAEAFERLAVLVAPVPVSSGPVMTCPKCRGKVRVLALPWGQSATFVHVAPCTGGV